MEGICSGERRVKEKVGEERRVVGERKEVEGGGRGGERKGDGEEGSGRRSGKERGEERKGMKRGGEEGEEEGGEKKQGERRLGKKRGKKDRPKGEERMDRSWSWEVICQGLKYHKGGQNRS